MKKVEKYLKDNCLVHLFHPISENLAISRNKTVLDIRNNALVFTNFPYGKEIVCKLNSKTTSVCGFKMKFNIEDYNNFNCELMKELDILDVRIQRFSDGWYLLSEEFVKSDKELYYPTTDLSALV